MRIVQVNDAYDPTLPDPDALLDRYRTLTGWSEALVGAGAAAVMVAQRFSVDAERERAGVSYLFRRDDGPAMPDARTRADALHAEVADWRPDLVHVNGLMFPRLLRSLRAVLPAACALVVQDHAGALPEAPPWWNVAARRRRAVLREGFAAADAFLFTSVDQARPWRQQSLITASQRVVAITESSTTMGPVPREEARAASGVTGRPVILWVGRLNANKDPIAVLDGFERAVDALPDARLWMVYGEDDLLGEVRARLDRSALLGSHVHLVGRVAPDRLNAFYSAADLFVLGSHREGSGYALIEAMACGLAPVVTDIPSFRAITGSGTVGALWPPGDARALADGLARTARLDAAASRREVRAFYDERLSWPALGRQALAIYMDVARAKGRRTRNE